MNPMQLPIAIRTTAAALAVFMTVATLNSLITVAEPQHAGDEAALAGFQHAGALGLGDEPLDLLLRHRAPGRLA